MLSRHMLRSSSLRQTSVSASTAAARVARLSTTRVDRVRSSAHALYATGGVSQQPGSKTFKELGQNAIEETKGIAQTVINTVSAKESGKLDNVDAAKDKLRDAKDDSMGTLKSDLDAVKGLVEDVPKNALVWGGLGLIPYAGTSLATVYLAREAATAVTEGKAGGFDPDAALLILQQVQQVQISYGAVLLSFLGAIHWGFEFSKYHGSYGNIRYFGGVVPCVIGWGSLLLNPTSALLVQWGGFFGTYYADMRATREGMTPKWYSTYRFWLTAIVGSSILLTLGGESYYGSDGKTMKQRSDVMKMASKASTVPTGTKTELGDMRLEQVDATESGEGGEGGGGYTKFTKIDKEAEAAEAKEREDKAAEERRAKEKKAEEERTKQDREDKAKRARSMSGQN